MTRWCREIWDNPNRGRLIVLTGRNGTGKTHCAKRILRWIQVVGPSLTIVPRPDFVTFVQCFLCKWPVFLDRLKGGEWDLTQEMIEYPVLIIDELGGEYDPTRLGVDKLCQILSRREFKWTLVTTNLPASEWPKSYDNRVNSRLFRNSTIIDLSDVPDFATQ